MTSVRTYSIEKDRAIQQKRKDAGRFAVDFWEGEKEVERRMAADVKQKRKDADRFGKEFWEGE